MSRKAFDKIAAGLNDAIRIARGEAEPGTYKVHVPEDVDVRSIRSAMGLTREDFALKFGFPVGTVRDWEQRRRRPEASARILLRMVERNPGVWKVAFEDPASLKQRVVVYNKARERFVRTLGRLERGARYFEALGQDRMHDVTEERRKEVESQLEAIDELITAYAVPLSVVEKEAGA